MSALLVVTAGSSPTLHLAAGVGRRSPVTGRAHLAPSGRTLCDTGGRHGPMTLTRKLAAYPSCTQCTARAGDRTVIIDRW